MADHTVSKAELLESLGCSDGPLEAIFVSIDGG